MANEKNKKWNSRRITIGLIWAIGFNFVFFWIASKGLDLKWFTSYMGYWTLGCLFFGGFLTMTDLMNKWKP